MGDAEVTESDTKETKTNKKNETKVSDDSNETKSIPTSDGGKQESVLAPDDNSNVILGGNQTSNADSIEDKRKELEDESKKGPDKEKAELLDQASHADSIGDEKNDLVDESKKSPDKEKAEHLDRLATPRNPQPKIVKSPRPVKQEKLPEKPRNDEDETHETKEQVPFAIQLEEKLEEKQEEKQVEKQEEEIYSEEEEEYQVDGDSNSRSQKRRDISSAEMGSQIFADSVRRTALWKVRGCRRIPGELNRVIVLVGIKDRSREWLRVACSVLKAAAHTDAIIMDHAGSKSIFHRIKTNHDAMPDIIGVGTMKTGSKCSSHRGVYCVADCHEEIDPKFIDAKLNMAANLAGSNKIILLNVAKEPNVAQLALLKHGYHRDIPILSIYDCHRPKFASSRYAAFPKPVKGNESEFASFIHIHLTVDLFSFH